eukprot:757080-Hanusia_phi.AAC.1
MAVLLVGLATCWSTMLAPPPHMRSDATPRTLTAVQSMLKLRGGGENGMGGVQEEEVCYPQPFYPGVEEETEERAPLRVQTVSLDITTLEDNLVSADEFFNTSAAPKKEDKMRKKRQQIFCKKLENPFDNLEPPVIDPEDEFDFAYNKDSDEISSASESQGNANDVNLENCQADQHDRAKEKVLGGEMLLEKHTEDIESLPTRHDEKVQGAGSKENSMQLPERREASQMNEEKILMDENNKMSLSESKHDGQNAPGFKESESKEIATRKPGNSKFDEFLKKLGLKREVEFTVNRDNYPSSIYKDDNDRQADFEEMLGLQPTMFRESMSEDHAFDTQEQADMAEKDDSFAPRIRPEESLLASQTGLNAPAVTTIPSRTETTRLQVKELAQNLRKYYFVFNASKVESAEQIASIFVHKMDTLDQMLLDKYGVSLTDFTNENDDAQDNHKPHPENATRQAEADADPRSSDKTDRLLAETFVEGKQVEKGISREQQRLQEEMWKIHRANLDQIKSMSQKEIEQANEQLTQKSCRRSSAHCGRSLHRPTAPGSRRASCDNQDGEERMKLIKEQVDVLFPTISSHMPAQEDDMARMYEGILKVNPNDFGTLLKVPNDEYMSKAPLRLVRCSMPGLRRRIAK